MLAVRNEMATRCAFEFAEAATTPLPGAVSSGLPFHPGFRCGSTEPAFKTPEPHRDVNQNMTFEELVRLLVATTDVF